MTLQQLEERLDQVLNSVDGNKYSLIDLNNKLYNKEIYDKVSEPTEGKEPLNPGYLQRLETLVEFLEASVRDERYEITRLYENIEPQGGIIVYGNSANESSIGVGIGYPNNLSEYPVR